MAATTPRPRGGAFALVALAAAVLAGAARADAPAPAELAERRYEWHRQHARHEAAGWEVDLVAQPRPGEASVAQFQDATALVNELRPALAADYEALRTAARKLAEASRARLTDAKTDWEAVYTQRVAFRRYADRQQAAHGFDLATGALPGFAPTALDAGIVVWAAVVFAVAVVLGRRTRRVSIRRARRAAGVAALLALAFVPGCSAGPAPERASAAREEAELAADTTAAREQADAAEKAADAKWNAALDSWAKLVAVRGAGGASLEAAVRSGETDTRARLRSAAVDARLADRLAAEASTDKAQLAADRAKLDDLTRAARWRSVGFTAARVAGAALLFGLAVAPYWRAARQEAAAVKADAKKCPRCFSEKLVVEKSGTIAGAGEPEAVAASQPRYRAGKAKPAPRAAAPASPAGAPAETGYVECKTCGFRFLRSYQRVRRLCFPAVGVRNSGKTHLLATAYDKVRKHTAPTAATAVPAPSLGDERFDLYIDLILNMKRDAGNTLHDVNTPPDPVMVHIRDADPAGASTALVNLFDYSGELVNQKIDVDRLKKQAVKMDGFMLFLDPTQLDGRAGGVTLDRQLAALNEFMADMREARGVGPGSVIPVPVAVVVPKFDLLVTRNPVRGQAVPFIRRLVAELTPPRPEQTTLGIVRERSEVVEDMLELMFRGVNVRALVESYFGAQVMFFPVSSVSLFENELGVEDLSRRTIAPYGVAEPFFWLLHMHGYEVFSRQ